MDIIQFNPDQDKDQPQTGIIKDEDNNFYHSVDAISNSKLACFRKRKYFYFKKYIKKCIPKEYKKNHFVFGGAAHCLILEGEEEFKRRYVVEPENAPPKPTKQRNEYVDQDKIQQKMLDRLDYWEKFNIEAEGKEVISQKQYRPMLYAKWSVEGNEVASALISEITPELTFRVSFGSVLGLGQARVDGFIESCSEELAKYLNVACRDMLCKEIAASDSIAIDLKTCATLTPDDSGSFDKHFGEFGYYIQDQFYREVVSKVTGRPLDHFFFIAVEKQEPFETKVCSTDQGDLDLAYSELKFDLEELKKCKKRNEWFSFDQEAVLVQSIPHWHRGKAERRLSMERNRNE